MPRQSRRTGHGKKHMRGGSIFGPLSEKAKLTKSALSKKADELTNSAIKKSADMGLHNKAAAAHQAAIGHATTAKKMVSDLSNHAMTKSMKVHDMMKPHLDSAASHANKALMYAQNKNVKDFNDSMGNFASAMGNAEAAGSDHITKNTKVGDASLAVHANAMSKKVTSAVRDTAKGIFGFGSKPKTTPASAVGGRRCKSHKNLKKGNKSRTMKNRRGHRMTKNKGMKMSSYKTRKVSNSKKMLKSRTKK